MKPLGRANETRKLEAPLEPLLTPVIRYVTSPPADADEGDADALTAGRELIEGAQNLNLGDRERLFGFLEGTRKVILPEPRPLLTESAKLPGLDGRKMSKSYNNSIFLREDPERGEVRAYQRVRCGMTALVHRNVFYRMAEMAEVDTESGKTKYRFLKHQNYTKRTYG